MLCLLLSAFYLLPSTHAASLWSNSTTPATPSVSDGNPWELGVKFTSDVSGYITGIRFYKGAGNTGTHIGHLWTSTGKLLASTTFTTETASGWQQANFAQPVQISANTVYVASYWDPKGHYSLNSGYFTTEFSNVPLHAPVNNGAAGSNGVYIYGNSAFPNGGYQASNFWVDVVFATTTGSTATSGTGSTTSTAPSGDSLFSASATPGTPDYPSSVPYELGVKFYADVSGSITAIRFYKGVNNTGTHVGHLWDSNGNLLSTATFSNETASGWQQVTLPSPVRINAGATYTASYWDPNGNNASDQNFFTSQLNNAPLHAVAGQNGVYNWNASGFPTGSYASTNYWVDVVFVPDAAGVSLFSASATPGTPDYPASVPYELGVKFYSDVPGAISAIRFYKGASNTGTHVAHLWDSKGNLLSTATFTSETASGWEQVNLPAPVQIQANTVYTASYWDPNGNNASDQNYFASQFNNAPLHAVAGQNGVYDWNASGFPTGSYGSTNYWVDVVFIPQSGTTTSNTSVTISSISPASGPVSGGTLTTINGSNFQSGASVSFGGANASSINFISSTQLTAVTPAGSAGAVSVTVTNSDPGTASLANAFMYVSNPSLTGASPSSGPTTGGTTVTLNGTGFQSGAIVAFGAMLATSVTVMSPTQIQAVTPAESAGTVSMTVTNPDAGKASLASAFTFVTSTQTTTSSSGALLTGMTASSYAVPSGWTPVDVNGFENGANNGLNNGEGFYGGSNTEARNCSFAHTGNCSIDTYITHSYGGVGIVLNGSVINNREIYVSWWQYTQQNNPGYGLAYTDWYMMERQLPGVDSLFPDWQPFSTTGGENPAQESFFQNNANQSTGPAPWAVYTGTFNEGLGQWVQYEVHMKVNDPGADNADFEMYQNGKLWFSVNKGVSNAYPYRCAAFGSVSNDCGYWVGNQDFTKALLNIGGDWGAITPSGSNQNMAACSPASYCPPKGSIPYFHIYIDDVIVLTKNGVQ